MLGSSCCLSCPGPEPETQHRAGKSLGRTIAEGCGTHAGSCSCGWAGGLGCFSSSWGFCRITGRNLKRHVRLRLWEPRRSCLLRAGLAACPPALAPRGGSAGEPRVQQGSLRGLSALPPPGRGRHLTRRRTEARCAPVPPATPLLQEAHLAWPASVALACSPAFASCLARETLRRARNTGSSTLTASGRQEKSTRASLGPRGPDRSTHSPLPALSWDTTSAGTPAPRRRLSLGLQRNCRGRCLVRGLSCKPANKKAPGGQKASTLPWGRTLRSCWQASWGATAKPVGDATLCGT